MSTDQQQQELGLREVGPVRRVEEYTFEPIRGYPMWRISTIQVEAREGRAEDTQAAPTGLKVSERGGPDSPK